MKEFISIHCVFTDRNRSKKNLAMDKLLLSLCFLLLTSWTVNSAPLTDSKLISTIDRRLKQYSHSTEDNDAGDDGLMQVENAESNQMQKVNKIRNQRNEQDDSTDGDADDNDQRREAFIRQRDYLLGETGLRHNKMVGYYPFNAFPFGYSAHVFYPPEFYDDFAAYYDGFNDEDDEVMSRANPSSNRRRPSAGSYKNSPIYYIRLPPTPYMFVPGLGYISQPPSYAPMTPVPQPISPFYNLPLDFISNGKPTRIYQWGSPTTQFNPQPQYVQQTPAFDPYPSYHQRPQRPPYSQRPLSSVNPFIEEAKVTNLKGPFLFNGRPEEIFLLDNPYSPIYPRFSEGFY